MIRGKKYTIFLIPHDTDQQVKKFSYHSKYLRIAAICLVVFLVAFCLLAWDYQNIRRQLSDYKELKRSVVAQQREIYNFAEKINSLNRKFAHLNEFNTKIRLMTNIDQPSPSTQVLNVGGPSAETGTQLMSAVEKGEDHLVAMIDDQLDQLDRQLYIEESRSEEINEFLKDQQSFLAAVPSIWPARGWLSSGFGYRISPFTGTRQKHEGIDIGTQLGRTVVAPADGVVTRIGWDAGFGRFIIVSHGYGYETLYAHLQKIDVKKGTKVNRGDKIGEVGNSGRSTGPHLHYEIHVNKLPVNPLNYILN